MKELGNLAIVCAKRHDITFKTSSGFATICVPGVGPRNTDVTRTVAWDDDKKIHDLILELNHGDLQKKLPQIDHSITKGDDSHEPRKKLWGRFGMEAEITECEFDLLQCGGHNAAALLTALLESHRLHLTGETYFPAVSKNGFYEFGDNINLDI